MAQSCARAWFAAVLFVAVSPLAPANELSVEQIAQDLAPARGVVVDVQGQAIRTDLGGPGVPKSVI